MSTFTRPSYRVLTDLPEYRCWRHVKARSFSPNASGYSQYGARGIVLCDEWRDDFWAFFDYLGPKPTLKHTIDRIDNDRGYEPGNVRWATSKEQSRNRRNTIFITYNGVTLAADQWADILGCDTSTLTMRRKRGWDDRRVIEEPFEDRDGTRGTYRGMGLWAALSPSERPSTDE
jgi:hypothetical protein